MGKLTPAKVKAVQEPGRYSDGDGLFLEVSPSGTKRWLLRIQSRGRRRDAAHILAVELAGARAAFLRLARDLALRGRGDRRRDGRRRRIGRRPGPTRGTPVVVAEPDSPQSKAFRKVAEEVARQVSIEAMKPELVILKRGK